MNPTNSELKACPFCGSTAIVTGSRDGYHTQARCGFCFAAGPSKLERSEAIAAWNTRKSEALADDAVEHIVNNAIVAKLIELRPNSKAIADWGDNRGFKCVEIPVGVGFMTIHTRPLALAALRTLTPSPAVDLLRDIREAVTLAREALDDCDETEAHALLSNVQDRIDAALKEAKDG